MQDAQSIKQDIKSLLPEELEAQYQLGRADARAARERIEAFLGTK